MFSPIQNFCSSLLLRLHSRGEQQSNSSNLNEGPEQPSLPIAFPENASETSGIPLKERVVPLKTPSLFPSLLSSTLPGPPSEKKDLAVFDKNALDEEMGGCIELPEDCEAHVILPVEQSSDSESKSVLPLLLLGETCHDLAPEKLEGQTSQNSHVGDIPPEDDAIRIARLLHEAQKMGISISRDIEGATAKINIPKAFAKINTPNPFYEEKQWECLKKVHDFIPIAHVECSHTKNVEALVLFLQSNNDLVSLDLGISSNMTDRELEEISQHLPALKSFSIKNARVRSIPHSICNQVERLECLCCTALKTLDAPAATKVDCHECKALKTLSAPRAATIDCHKCEALTTLSAPAATKIDCHKCEALTTLSAPAATKVDCHECKALTTLNAPAATKVDCLECKALTTLNAPRAVTIDCCDCAALTTLSAPAATTIDCSNCIALTSLSAPAATKVACWHCEALSTLEAPAATSIACGFTALKTLEAPAATTIQCFVCTSLTSLDAPAATTIDCDESRRLATLNAPRATRIGGLADTALTKEARLKVLTRLRKNITLVACYAEQDQDFDKQMKQVEETQDKPLNRWLTNAIRFILPAHFDSKAEENDSKQKIDGFLKDLITLASAERAVKEEDLEWFKALKKLDSLQQQMKRVKWLGALVMCSAPGKNPFADPSALSTLTALGNLENPFLQQELTRTLLSMYDEEASEQFKVWKDAQSALKGHQILPHLKRHQILPHLLFSSANLKEVSPKDLLKIIEPNYYKDTAVLTPILEMLCMLSSSAPALQEKLLKLIFKKSPEAKKGERKDQSNLRVAAHRKEQSKLLRACRDLLFFAKFDALLNVENEGDLLETHKTICQEIFGVRDEFVHQFSDAFTSKRYSNALLTYAARLQILAPEKKNLLTELLGKFVNAHLEGNFPACRYDLSVNPHLDIIFKKNPALLEKWVSPLEIDLTHSERLQRDSLSDPCELIKKRMATAIADGHLGSDQNATYPTLTVVLGNKSVETLAKSLAQLKEELDRLKTTASRKNKQKQLAIEIDCLNALDPEATLAERIDTLNSLLAKLPNGLEFRNDVEGVLKALQQAKVSLQRIESTEAWEDLLLMGTEVSNSCQRIDGDPHLNKCLLAYILDGKNKAIIVRDAEGKIAARTVLRILWNEKLGSPVLFMERVYARTGDSDLPALIKRGCMQKAKEMGLPLVASTQDAPEGLPYKGVLSALGGPAPFEYVDALCGIQKNGKFEINASRLLYMPG